MVPKKEKEIRHFQENRNGEYLFKQRVTSGLSASFIKNIILTRIGTSAKDGFSVETQIQKPALNHRFLVIGLTDR